MNKTKTERTKPLSRILLVFCGLVFLATSFMAMLPAPAAYADVPTESEANARSEKYCTLKKFDTAAPRRGGISEFKACERGYRSSIQGQEVDWDKICKASDIQGTAYDACVAGFKEGMLAFKALNPTSITEAEANKRSSAYCDQFDKKKNHFDLSEYITCERGYRAAIRDEKAVVWDVTCKDLSGNLESKCITGFKQGLREYVKDAIDASNAPKPIPQECPGGTQIVPLETTTSDICDTIPAGCPGSTKTGSLAPGTKCPYGVAGTTPGGSDEAGGDLTTTNKKLSCDYGESGLSWLVCGFVDIMVFTIGKVDGLITEQLSIETNQIFCDSDVCQAYHTAWMSFRNIALGLMVIAGLVIAIAQALGMEILDAYTVRKTLPRLLIAALGITLSWPLMQFAISLSNDLGVGIRHLIYAPFIDLNDKISPNLKGSVATVITSFGGLTIFGIMGLLSFALTGALAVFIAIVVLVLRQIAVILLLILAPIFIIAYVLPNTQRVYKFWWEGFSKALLMFPLIAAFIASGRVFSAIALSNNGGALNQVIGFSAYFAPYFLIPATFKFAGGALRAIGGAVNDRGRGAFGRLSKYRSDKAGANLKKTRSGQRWDSNFGRFTNPITKKQSGIGHLANRAAVNIFDADELIPYRLGKPRDNIAGIGLGTKKDGTKRTLGGLWGLKGGSMDLQDQLDNRVIDESKKAYQHVTENGGMHYEGWRGVAGRHQDFTGETGRTTRRDGSVPIDEATGKARKVTVAEAMLDAGFTDGQAPRSLSEFRTMSQVMQESSNDKERKGGSDMAEHMGYLSKVKTKEGMDYADTQIAGAVGLAVAGRTEGESAAGIANSVGHRINEGVGQRTMQTIQSIASGTERPDQRDGHGFIVNKDTGEYESAYTMLAEDGKTKLDWRKWAEEGNSGVTGNEQGHFNSDTALGSVRSGKDSSWQGAKAEAVEAAAPTFIHMARGMKSMNNKHDTDNRTQAKVESDQLQIKNTIMHGIQSPYNDPGQRAAWAEVALASKEWTKAEIDSMTQAGAKGADVNKPPPTSPGTGAPTAPYKLPTSGLPPST